VNWLHVSIHQFGDAPLLVSYFLVVLLAAYLSLYPLLFAYLVRRLQVQRAVMYPVLWTLTEFLRGWVFTGFPWLQFGYTQIDSPFAGIAPIFGVTGLTFLAMFLSAVAFNIVSALWNSPKKWNVIVANSLILVVIGDMIGGRSGMIMMFVISMGMNFMSYWYSDKIVLAQYNAQPVTAQSNPKLYAMVDQLAKNGNLPMPKVYIIPSEVPNAFATGRNPSHAAVAVTEGIQRLLTDEELEGVLAHELTHVKNRDTLISTIAAMMAGAISMIANILQFTAIFGRSDDREGTNPLALLGTIIIAPIAAGLIQMSISRTREFLADEGGGDMCRNPLALASALAKIDYYSKHGALPNASNATAHMFIINPMMGIGESLSNLFSTHPRTEERIQKLKKQAMNPKYKEKVIL